MWGSLLVVEASLVRQCSRLGVIAAFVLSLSANALGNELSDRLTMTRKVGTLLESKQISQLDAMFTEARKEKTRTESGVWRLTVLYVAIANALPEAPPQPECTRRKTRLKLG